MGVKEQRESEGEQHRGTAETRNCFFVAVSFSRPPDRTLKERSKEEEKNKPRREGKRDKQWGKEKLNPHTVGLRSR